MKKPRDYPKADLIRMANETLEKYRNKPGVTVQLFFKATCPKCGERCQYEEPNKYYENMTCATCGHEFPFTKGGLLLTITRSYSRSHRTK